MSRTEGAVRVVEKMQLRGVSLSPLLAKHPFPWSRKSTEYGRHYLVDARGEHIIRVERPSDYLAPVLVDFLVEAVQALVNTPPPAPRLYGRSHDEAFG